MDIQATKLELIKKLLDTSEETVLADVWKILEEGKKIIRHYLKKSMG